MKRNVMWFRRDLRLGDNPALLAAIENSDEIIPLFILDPNLIKQAGSKRLAYLGNSLRALDESLGGRLHVIAGDQIEVLQSFNPNEVHISKEYEPYGAARDKKVAAAGIKLVETGSPYAVAPGRVRKPDDTNYRVYTPFYKGWLAHGWRDPVAAPKKIN
ncbi:MAG: deoxyribodipyrimidine photo-lyase, partial [Candidatus Nanopelagicaceae bacterium]